MSFTKRLLRIPVVRANIPALSEAEKAGNEVIVASENIALKWESETYRIGKPRASGLYKACMRAHVIGHKENLDQKRWASFGQKLVFGFGNAIHDWAQNKPDLFGNRRRGWWKCTACAKIVSFGPPPKNNCKFCGARREAIRYHEHFFNLKGDWPVTGHLDMFLEKMKAVYRVVEIKTMNDEEFQKLIAPLIDHAWQIQTYMLGANESALPVKVDQNLGYVLYISKKWKKNRFPVKMYPVEKDEYLIERIKTKLGLYKAGMDDYPNLLPMLCPECTRGGLTNYRAKFCAALPFCKKYLQEGV